MAEQARIREGDSIALALERDGSIVLRSQRRRYQLSELVSRITPRNRHGETGWGPPQGKESW
jgi:antitoxin MazE